MILGNLSFLELYTILKPVSLFIFGMVIYSVFVFKFYKFLSKRDIFELDLKQYNRSEHFILQRVFAVSLYVLEYILLFPIFVFFWFLVLVVLLSFLSKNQPLETIVLISIAVVGAVRVTSYYNEDLSRDLAKMLPFALLGVFLVDLTFFSFVEAIEKVGAVSGLFSTLLYYLVFIISLEFMLRFLHFIFYKPKKPIVEGLDSD